MNRVACIPCIGGGNKRSVCPTGGHLILLYFIRIPLLSAETFYLFSGWGPTFWFFKSLEYNMVYSLGIYIYLYTKGIVAEQKSYGF